ncbi:MAG TPA: MFS transporter [Methylomirabilota bacterium]|jgi:MFS family permease|nr:MFS transporter [Methylomirabilota bacterium]
MRSDRAWLAAVCAAELGTMLVFSNFSALLPLLTREWNLSNTEAGLILAFYQVGYIGTVAILATLTDYMPPRRIYLWSAAWTGLTGLAFAYWAQGFLSALVLRGLVGLGLAGTYMPGMRMVAERFAHGRRGFAMGCYIGTFTIGTSISLLLTSWANGLWGWRWAFAITGLGPLAAGLIGGWVLPREMARPAQVNAGARVGLGPVLKNARALRLIAAYGGHTFELMGMRGWIVPFFTASLVTAGAGLAEATQKAGLAASAVLAIGALPHPFSGLLSDRFGRAPLISGFMLLSATCSLAIGWALHWPFGSLVALGLLYGLLVTAESAVISTGIADAAEPAYLGRTMALQSSVGFACGALGPAAFGVMLDWAPRIGVSPDGTWIWAFGLLGAAALAGPLAVGFRELSRQPETLIQEKHG